MQPATCNSSTGQCDCPTNFNLVTYALNDTQQTCQCSEYPYYYNGSQCINALGNKKRIFSKLCFYSFF